MFPKYYNNVELVITDKCPFNCKYCFVKNKHDASADMSMDVVDRTFQLFKGNTPRVIFMGGEPLTRVEFMKDIISKYPHMYYQVVTSGLINVDYFLSEIRNKVDVFDFQISWDGFKSSRESPQKVFDTMLDTLFKGEWLQARCVISDENVDNLCDTFCALLDVRNKFPSLFNFDFTIAYQKEYSEEFPLKLATEFRKVLDCILVNDIRFIPQSFLRFFYKFLNTGEVRCFCGVGNYVAIKPNGDCYPCTSIAHLEEFRLGNVKHPRSMDFSSIEDLRNFTPAECSACDLLEFCGGGCRYERILCGDFSKCVKHRCSIMKCLYTVISDFYNNLLSVERERIALRVLNGRCTELNYADKHYKICSTLRGYKGGL